MINTILLQQAGGGNLSGIFMIIAMVAVFYFFMIRPQQKKQKELKRQREAMQKGDKIVTAGGIHGRIKEINDGVILVEVAEGVKIKVDAGSVYPVVEAPEKK